ncbi:uncharacterized protein C4orf17 homolog [Eublepharis macularius]|uniref:Uncharacterized protein C4orf17 homolog n=1 Tax=Eublepharis macularius TaxID=481883 RepID=A0AA97L9B5_EUBMA|nr:uncharacterized protein C4orf17 homolog [Eublepharis macularius]
MNINFRAQPEPQLSLIGSIKPGPKEGNTSSFLCRHNPHPRPVSHVKGLNNVPVCVVRDSGNSSGHFIMPEIEQRQSLVCTRTAVGCPFSETTTPSLPSLTSRKKSFPKPISHAMKEDIAQLPKRTGNTLILNRKGDPLRKHIPEKSQTMPAPDVRALSPALALRYRPEIIENMNYSSTYLDNEIKILGKLRDILQIDSIAVIQDWVSKASLKEKEFISNFIRSDITTRDLLNYHQQNVQSRNEVAHLNLQAMLKGPKAKESTEEEKQLRNINEGSTASTGTRSDRGRDHLLTRKEKIRIPTVDSLPLDHSPTIPKIQESKQTSPRIPQTNSQLLYTRSRGKRPQRNAEQNKPPKNL